LDPDVLYTQIITDRDLATTKRASVKGLFSLTVRKQAESSLLRNIKGLLGLAVRKQVESSLLRKELSKKEALLDTYRTRKSGKRVILKDQINVSRDSI
jgi:hypothetical protein